MPSWDAFQRAPVPLAPHENEAEIFAVIPAGQRSRHWVGRDHRGFACLMLVAEGAPAAPRELRLECLLIQYSLPCEIQSSHNEPRSLATLTVVRCSSPKLEHQRLFVELVDTIIAVVGSPATAIKLDAVIRYLTAIFSSLSLPARATIQGLWGELLVINLARNPARLLRAWHDTVGDDFDFSEGTERVEVKTTSSRTREHLFSLEQLRPAAGSVALIASLIVRSAGGGETIADLATKIQAQVEGEPELMLKLSSLISQTLGQDWANRTKLHFDRELAAESLAFFTVDSIPKIDGELPPGVSGVSFLSDLSGVLPVRRFESGSFFHAASARSFTR